VRSEFSAGGVVTRHDGGTWSIAAIKPAGKPSVWALPKGHIDDGEQPADAAAREVREETGLEVDLIDQLGSTRYVYTWEGERTFKVVAFFLFRATGGEIGVLEPEYAHEVADTCWIELDTAASDLTYSGEREIVARARERLSR